MPIAKKYKLLLLTLLFISASHFYAQSQVQFRFHHITTNDGLSQGLVNCIIQDDRGFMWFGTQDGLNRYDGNGITVIKNNPVDSNSIASNNINCLFEDKERTLWIGTDAGLSALNLYTGKLTNYYSINSQHPENSNIHTVYEDKQGTIWVGTEFNSLCKFDRQSKKFKTYALSIKDTGSLAFDYVSSVTEDDAGTMWLGSYGGGLYSFDRNTGKYENYSQDSKTHFIMSFVNNVSSVYYQHDNNELLIGTRGSGLEAFSIANKKFTSYYKEAEDTLHMKYPKVIFAVTKDNFNNTWVASGNAQGLYKFEEPEKIYISYKRNHKANSAEMNQDFCNCLYVGNDNILWVGTNDGVGYYIPERRNFSIYADTAHASANVVMSMAQDAGGKLWIGTNGSGLRTYDGVTHEYSENEALKKAMNNISVLALCIDKKDNLWVGTYGSGVLGYNLLTEKIIHIDSLNSAIAKTSVLSITQDYTGKVWVGTYDKGVFVYDEKNSTIDRITVNNGLSDNRVYNFYEDDDHNMWVCTDGGGLNCIHPDGKITIIKKKSGNNSLSSNSVNCVYKDKQGNLWFGTSIGLNKYIAKKDTFVHYFAKDGLPNDYIYSILPDKEGNLWMSTNKGISKFNPNVNNDGGSAFKNYDAGDGLPADEFNQGAYLETDDGKMFFGSMNGIVSFYPEKVIGNIHEPPVCIISFEVFGKDFLKDTLITGKKNISLLWNQNTISFSFVGLDYEAPAKNKYKYFLEGVDHDWSPPSTRHWASYAQLPPGHYVFRVKACNNDNVWSPVGAAVCIDIIPPFWRTNWFYATCIILILASIFGFIKYRTSRIEKEKKILEAKVEQRTHELAQKNRDITSSIEYAKRIQQAILPPLEQIKQFLPKSFVLYLPKDIVAGDFYWFGEQGNKVVLVAADCTGHGVPGALMSMIGHNLLNQIVLEKGITKPATILNHLNTMVQTALKQGVSNIDTTDGMDIALCCFDKGMNELEYAGANRPLIIALNGELKKIDPDKMPIGGTQLGIERTFTNHVHKIRPGETIFMFSDGYADQFGGEKGKKFMMRRFLDTLQQIKDLPVNEQQTHLYDALLQWQGTHEQVDDILVIGIKS